MAAQNSRTGGLSSHFSERPGNIRLPIHRWAELNALVRSGPGEPRLMPFGYYFASDRHYKTAGAERQASQL